MKNRLIVVVFMLTVLTGCRGGPGYPPPDEFNGWIGYSLRAKIFAEDIYGNMWIGLYKFDGQKWQKFFQNYENEERSIACGKDGSVWMGFIKFVVMTKDTGNTWDTYNLPSGELNRITVDDSNYLWAATTEGVRKFDGDVWTTFTTLDNLPSDTVLAIQSIKNNIIVACTEKGVAIYKNNVWLTHKENSEIPDTSYTNIVKDFQGNAWFPGFKKYDGNNWINLNIEKIEKSSDMCNITFAVDLKGNLWAGFYYKFSDNLVEYGEPPEGNGILKYNMQTGVITEFHSYSGEGQYDPPGNSGLLHGAVYSIFVDSHNNKWMGTYGGVSEYTME